MIDVAIIGGGHAGTAIAGRCMEAGLDVSVIEQAFAKPDNWPTAWVTGRGVVSGPGMVTVLDPATGDERQVIPARAIVLAIGQIDPADPSAKMLGITKFGAELSPDGKFIQVNPSGRTRAEGIFASGGVASGSTPYLQEELNRYCSKAITEEKEG